MSVRASSRFASRTSPLHSGNVVDESDPIECALYPDLPGVHRIPDYGLEGEGHNCEHPHFVFREQELGVV